MHVTRSVDPKAAAGGKRRILFVDDVEVNRIVTAAILESAAYDVHVVPDGTSALQALEAQDYDLVLLDIDMPGLDGHETARRMRDIENGGVRLAALTASTRAGLREDSADIGLDAHIERPIEPQALLREVADILRQPNKGRGSEPWDRPMYKELVRRLGPARMRALLVRLVSELEALQMLLSWPDNAATLHRRAHDIASIAGMLGFIDVTRCCRALMERIGTGDEAMTRIDLERAVTAALKRLTDYLATEPEAEVA